jgi:hypothetical protein
MNAASFGRMGKNKSSDHQRSAESLVDPSERFRQTSDVLNDRAAAT